MFIQHSFKTLFFVVTLKLINKLIFFPLFLQYDTAQQKFLIDAVCKLTILNTQYESNDQK